MNVEILRQSDNFQEFMKRVNDLGKDAANILKTETDLMKIGRAQGRLLNIDDINGLLDQIEAEQEQEEKE